MKKIGGFVFLLLAYTSLAFGAETLEYGRFGRISLYRGPGKPRQLILFASGDGGWNLGVVDMAKAVATEGVVVAGFDTVKFLKRSSASGKCLYPAGDLELLSKFVQSKLGFSEYSHPILVGYSSGATLAYGAIAQAPANTFSGALSLGFCSDIESKMPFCRGFGLESEPIKTGFDFRPFAKGLPNWAVLHGDQDKVCSLASVQKFVGAVKGASLVTLPGVGHGFSVQKNWMPQFQEQMKKISAPSETLPPATTLPGLPLVEVPAENKNSDAFVVLLSGDGGWAGFDRDLSQSIANQGFPVVGLNSLKYFWAPKTPEQGAADLSAVIDAYAKKWKKKKVIILGFSFGADVAPVFVNRLAGEVKAKVKHVALISMGKTAEFAFHFSDWISEREGGVALAPELAKLAKVTKISCWYGEDEAEESGCPSEKIPNLETVKLPGGHHVELGEAELAKILK